MCGGGSFLFFLSVPCFAMHGLQLYKVSRLYFAERPECVFTCVMNNCNITLQVNVRVTTMDAELEFAIQPNTTGKQLFDQVGTKLETFAAHPSPFFYIGCLLTSPQVSGWAVKLWAIQFCKQLKLKEKGSTRKRWSDWNSWPGRRLASAVNIFSRTKIELLPRMYLMTPKFETDLAFQNLFLWNQLPGQERWHFKVQLTGQVKNIV